MRVYYTPQGDDLGVLVAIHAESQNIMDSAYGATVRSFSIDDLKDLARVGDAPPSGQWDNRLIKIPSMDITILRASTTKTMMENLTAAADTITSKYTQSEQLSWPTKDAAARAYLAGETLTETQNTLLQSEASAGGGTDLKVLCQGIVANADAFAKISGTLAGLRTAAVTAIDKAGTQKELDAVLVDLSNKIAALFTSLNATTSAATTTKN